MRIDYISDLHLDFYLKKTGHLEIDRSRTEKFLEQLLPETIGDVVIIAGDLSHENTQSFDSLNYFSQLYKQVFFVWGNHDYYLISNSKSDKYRHNSTRRLAELLQMMDGLTNVQLLENYEAHLVDGIRFAGATNWYPLERAEDVAFFKERSNDSRLIKGFNIKQAHDKETYLYDQLLEVDVLITHVPPLFIDSHEKEGNTSCYLNKLDDVSAKVCVFGHCHERNSYREQGVSYYVNALGYPDEQEIGKIKSFTI